MDTNQVVVLSQQVKSVDQNTVLLIVNMLIASLGPLLLAMTQYVQKKSLDGKAEEKKKAVEEISDNIKKVHTMVNGNTVMLLRKLDDCSAEVTRVTAENAKLNEQLKSEQVRTALMTQVPFVPLNDDQLKQLMLYVKEHGK